MLFQSAEKGEEFIYPALTSAKGRFLPLGTDRKRPIADCRNSCLPSVDIFASAIVRTIYPQKNGAQ